MIICVPTMGKRGLDENVGEHFGRVPTYTIVDIDTEKVKVVPNTSHHVGGSGYPPEIMANEGVNAMICRGLGRRAITMFKEIGIEVYIGASGTVKDAISAFKEDRLQRATETDACGQHAFRDQQHHDHNQGHCD